MITWPSGSLTQNVCDDTILCMYSRTVLSRVGFKLFNFLGHNCVHMSIHECVRYMTNSNLKSHVLFTFFLFWDLHYHIIYLYVRKGLHIMLWSYGVRDN